jgi:2-oxoglutarate dehydrogenase E2 component (dihydrolipoamide succinyltransferase)
VTTKVEEPEVNPIQPVAHTDTPTDVKKERPIASPSARKLAREKGLDLSQIPTADPLGRIRAQDVQGYTPQQQQVEKPAPSPAQARAPKGDEDNSKPVERIRMSRRRQTIANRLVEVQHTAAMLTTFNEVDMTNVINLRKRRKDSFLEENDVKLGFMSFFTKAVVAALKKSPLLNAEIQDDQILLKKFYDIGIAVSAPEGLVVPVVRDADRKNFAEIEKDILNLADKARQNRLALNDLQGGTFTITNGGVFGSLLSTPILNGPQVGILGMHATKLRPIAIDEERIENRPMMYIALSYDHRIVDGKEAVTFLKRVKELIEDPESLIFE